MGMKRLLKDASLPIGMGTGIIVYLIFALLPGLSGAAAFFSPIFDKIVPLFMFLILFVTFCKVDFRRLRPVKWHLAVAVFQIAIIAIIMAVILCNRLKGEQLVLMESLLVCVIAPCAAAAPVVTQKLGGDLEQMTTYTFLTNLITALSIPICFPMIEKSADITFLSAFLTILREVTLVLVVPMLLAYIVKHYIKRLHRRIVAIRDLGYYLWAVSLTIVTGVTMKNICNAHASTLLLAAIALLGLFLCIVQFAVGRWLGHFSGHTSEGGQALGQKNTAFAIWIAYTYLNPLSSVGPGCYILWQNIINSIELWEYERHGHHE